MERQDGSIGCRHVGDDREPLDRVKHGKQIAGKNRSQAVGRGVPGDPLGTGKWQQWQGSE